ncbi:glycoside hydrolase family 3 protein [Hyaloscypha variabilis F]|uniref:Probable beta-glucosidase G n=1 Tax=Hyaloscypha variabilis (strain UAMH 11265 / GT02V1 / F) TaxID=1149755 RepID=A0A2J6QR96_HYAVF|nr:glycoside hydrolase family 3 protein [Hyaloscypha variabilis F]PMD30506.1 glycoside hydrolase family 3 protein [Hyaloscypha variabilis F]
MYSFLAFDLFFRAVLLLSLVQIVFAQGNKGVSNASPSSETGSRDWQAASQKALAFVAQLNLTEKASMVTGTSLSGACVGNIAAIERLGFSGICVSDGPTAVNRYDLVSVFPAGIAAAASWDRDLMYQRGLLLGAEFKAKGTHVGLGPVAGPLGRHPLGGRNWEGFSPDPYLTGIAMNFTINGMQDAGVQSCSKHLIGNEQETQRSNTVLPDGTNIEAISSNIDDRTLHELYLWPFADAVKAGTTSVMCSYNRVNETYSCENSELLTGLLKNELGFEGYVMSDFFATHSGVTSINAGLDMDMPGSFDSSSVATRASYFGRNVTQAVTNGSVSMERLDNMVQRIMTPYFLLGQDKDYPTVDPSAYFVLATTYSISLPNEVPARDVRGNHSTLIHALGAAGTVLLKNTNSTLPLRAPMNIGVFGNDAIDPTNGLTWPQSEPQTGFEFGTLDIGGGSGSARHTTLVSPLQAIKARAALTGARVQYLTSNAIIASNEFTSIYPTPDVCLVFLKTFSQEGYDRLSFEADWNSTLVVNNIAARCINTVVITHSAGVNTMPWATNPNVTAILAAHYPGEESGNSIVDILWGDVNPSGKLPYTIPVKEADYDIPIVNLTAVTDPNTWQANFTEGLMIDYRHFDALSITPLYEFGHGLSYTTFSLSLSLTLTHLPSSNDLSPFPNPSSPIAPGGNVDLFTPLFTASTTVSNTGSVAGATVVQIYVSLPQNSTSAGTPVKVLRGFEKVFLQPGEAREAKYQLTRRDVSFWDVVAQNWRIPEGDIGISVGFSSRDLKQTKKIKLL